MFEFSIAKKYLLPKRKQLSVSLIALMSVIVISLVVWLMLLFLSITDGIERGWIDKLTTLNGPIRITPTQEYFSSYYHQIDNYSSSSSFATKSLGQKAKALRSDPYDPNSDMELPKRFPKPQKDAQGILIDPVKIAFQRLHHLGVTFQDYEIGGAMLRLQMLRSPSGDTRDLSQSFLTQVAYVSSFTDQNPKLSELLLPPTPQDLEQLLLMSSFEQRNCSEDIAESIERVSPEISSAKLEELLRNIEITQIKTHPFWEIPKRFLPKDFRKPAHGMLRGDKMIHVVLTAKENEQTGVLSSEKGRLVYVDTAGKQHAVEDPIPVLSEEAIEFDASLCSKQPLSRFSDLFVSLESNLHGLALKGDTTLEGLKISGAKTKKKTPLLSDANGVWLPKQFQDSGILMGDGGYLSFSAQGASSVQEQRLPITVLGFYDPGIMAIGNKCILAPPQLVHSLNLANKSFQMDPTFSSGIQVWVDDLSQVKQIKAAIESDFASQGIAKYWKVTTYLDYDFAKDLLQQFQSDKTLFTLIGIIILSVACCNIISLLVLLVNDKKTEIGILQAMGASTRSIAIIFALCGAGMGVISSFIGIGAAMLTLQNIDSIVHFLSFVQGHDMFNAMFYGKTLPNALSSDALRFVLIATPLLSLLAGLVPALKACRLKPSAVLRAES